MKLTLNEKIDLLDVYEKRISDAKTQSDDNVLCDIPLDHAEKVIYEKLVKDLKFDNMSLKDKIKFIDNKVFDDYIDPSAMKMDEKIEAIVEYLDYERKNRKDNI